MENNKLYIPVPIRKNKEIAEGIGIQEVIKIAILVAIGVVVGLILFIPTKQVYNLVLPPLFLLMFGIIFYKKDITNKNAIDRIKEMINFSKSQKVYRYRYYNIYEEEVNEKHRKKQRNPKEADSE